MKLNIEKLIFEIRWRGRLIDSDMTNMFSVSLQFKTASNISTQLWTSNLDFLGLEKALKILTDKNFSFLSLKDDQHPTLAKLANIVTIDLGQQDSETFEILVVRDAIVDAYFTGRQFLMTNSCPPIAPIDKEETKE